MTRKLTDFEKAEIKAYKEARKEAKIFDGEWRKLDKLEEGIFILGFHEGFKAATDQQEAKIETLRNHLAYIYQGLLLSKGSFGISQKDLDWAAKEGIIKKED